jgi:phage gp36-like protein
VSYCAVADVLAVLNPTGGMTTASSAAALPAPIISNDIARAEDFVNGWLAQRYDVPFDPASPVPDLVARITADIAAFYAVTDAAGDQSIPPTHPATLRYGSAVATCQALSAGRMTLALPATDGPDTGTQDLIAAGVSVQNPNLPLFCPEDAWLHVGYGGRRRNPFGPSESDFY